MNKNEILINLSESEQTRYGIEDFHIQSIPQKVFSSIWELESEVNNGGFSQYFENSAETVPFIVEALLTIGASGTAQICNRAIACAFGERLPATREAISSAANSLPADRVKELDRLDAAFFGYPDDLTELLFAFVLKHPEEFGSVPDSDQQGI